jgi:hypothetical protein
MLHIIEDYEFNSIASQQAILVLDFLKKAFSDEELEILKEFVKKNLSNKSHLKLASGRSATNTNLAALIKMALVLKAMTNNLASDNQTANDNQHDDEESKDSQTRTTQRDFSHLNDNDWQQFC